MNLLFLGFLAEYHCDVCGSTRDLRPVNPHGGIYYCPEHAPPEPPAWFIVLTWVGIAALLLWRL